MSDGMRINSSVSAQVSMMLSVIQAQMQGPESERTMNMCDLKMLSSILEILLNMVEDNYIDPGEMETLMQIGQKLKKLPDIGNKLDKLVIDLIRFAMDNLKSPNQNNSTSKINDTEDLHKSLSGLMGIPRLNNALNSSLSINLAPQEASKIMGILGNNIQQQSQLLGPFAKNIIESLTESVLDDMLNQLDQLPIDWPGSESGKDQDAYRRVNPITGTDTSGLNMSNFRY